MGSGRAGNAGWSSLTAAPIVAQATGQAPCDPTDSAADDWLDQNNAQPAPQVGAGELLFLDIQPDRAVLLSGNGITMHGTNQHMRVMGAALE